MTKDLKSPKFVKWVRDNFVCWWCGNKSQITPHHLRNDDPNHTRRYQDYGNIIPLCFRCHRFFHDKPKMERSVEDRMKGHAKQIHEHYEKLRKK